MVHDDQFDCTVQINEEVGSSSSFVPLDWNSNKSNRHTIHEASSAPWFTFRFLRPRWYYHTSLIATSRRHPSTYSAACLPTGFESTTDLAFWCLWRMTPRMAVVRYFLMHARASPRPKFLTSQSRAFGGKSEVLLIAMTSQFRGSAWAPSRCVLYLSAPLRTTPVEQRPSCDART